MLKWRGEFLVFFLASFLSDICGSIRSIASGRNWQKSRIPEFLSALAGSFQQTGSRRSQCSRREIVNSGDVAGSQTFKGSEVWPPVVKQGRWCSLRSATESLSQALKSSLQLLLETTANNDKFKFYLNADCNTPWTMTSPPSSSSSSSSHLGLEHFSHQNVFPSVKLQTEAVLPLKASINSSESFSGDSGH